MQLSFGEKKRVVNEANAVELPNELLQYVNIKSLLELKEDAEIN